MNTSTRTLLVFLLLLTAGFAFLLDQLSERVERQYLEAAEEPMVDAAHVLAAVLEQHLLSDRVDVDLLRSAFEAVHQRQLYARIYGLVKTTVDLDVYVTDGQGRVIFNSRKGEGEGEDYSRYHDVKRTLEGRYGARSTRTREEDSTSSIMYVGAPIRRNGAIVGVVSVSKPQASMFEFIAETRHHILLYGWSILLAIGAAAILVAHWLFRPVRKLTDYARSVRCGERVALPRLSSPDMRMLGSALEAMRDSLEDRKYVESYVQSLTHEMKGPIAAIRGAAELLQEPDMPAHQREHFLSNIRLETQRLQNVADRLLTLSAIEGIKVLQNQHTIQLAELVDTLCEEHLGAVEAGKLRFERCYGVRPEIRGERYLLEVAIGNLLQNAIDFSPPGAVVRVTIKMSGSGERVELLVEDEGPGVPAYALDRVFDRFYSLQHPKTGRKSSGLGLCFVREAALLHGGEASLENRTDRAGARALLALPLGR